MPFYQIFSKNNEPKTTHNTLRDCRVHFFRQPFSKQLYTARVICFHNATTSLTSSFLPSLFACYMYHCVDCEQYLIAFLKSVGVTHRARCNLRSGVFFFSDYRDKGRGHDRRLRAVKRAVCCETRDTRVSAGETLVACRAGCV